MRLTRRQCLILEQLEDRLTPSLTLSYAAGSLTISGTPTGAGAPGLAITGLANGTLQVMDGSRFLGDFNVTNNLNLNLNSHPSFISMNLTALPGSRFNGNVNMSLGIGNTNTTLLKPVFLYGGTIGGNVTITGGSGDEAIELGVTPGLAFSLLNVGGSVSMTGRAVAPFPALSTFPTAVELAPGSNVGGNITTTQVATVNVGTDILVSGIGLSTVGGSVTANDATGAAALFMDIAGAVGKNVSFTGLGHADFVGNGDSFLLNPGGTAGGGVINGNLTVNLGNNSVPGPFINVELDDDGTNPFVVNGNVNVSSTGASSDSITFGLTAGVQNQINGSVNLNLGSGADSITVDHTSISGNVSISAGNGNDTVNVTSNAGLFGALAFQLGNGNSSITVSSAPFGLFSLTAGNGANSITLTPAVAGNWTVNWLFGTGSNTVTLGGTASTIFGSIVSQANPLANTFTQDGWSNQLSTFQF